MHAWAIGVVSATALGVSIVGVVTGGNSLVTVPLLMAFGMDARAAVVTNMFALTFLSLSGAVRFSRAEGAMRWDLCRWLLPLTFATSWLGAYLLRLLPERSIAWLVAGSLVVMLGVMLATPRFGEQRRDVAPSRLRFTLGVVACAVLGVYGGVYSAGYATLLTFVCVGLLDTTLLEALGLTKVVNVVSSAIATVEFARAGLVELRVAMPMAAAMMVGAWIGAHLAVRRGTRWMRPLLLAMVALMAIKLLVFDLRR